MVPQGHLSRPPTELSIYRQVVPLSMSLSEHGRSPPPPAPAAHPLLLVRWRHTTILPATPNCPFPRTVGKSEQVRGSWLSQNIDFVSQLPALVTIQPVLKVHLSVSVRLLSHWWRLTSFRGTFSYTDPSLLCIKIQSAHLVPAPFDLRSPKCCLVFPGPGSTSHGPRTPALHGEPHSSSQIVNAMSRVRQRLA